MAKPVIAVLVTLDSKGAEARFVCDVLVRAGADPWLVDLSLRPHGVARISSKPTPNEAFYRIPFSPRWA